MEFISVPNNNYLKEGKHNAIIETAVLGEYADGSTTLDCTFKSIDDETKGAIHLAKMATRGFRTYNVEENGNAKTADALTEAERASGLFGQEKDDDGNIISRYAIKVAKMEKGKLVKLPKEQWTRVPSEVKTRSCMEIIGRLANSVGIPTGEKFSEADLVGLELTIELEKKMSAEGNYVRLKNTSALVEEEI